MRTLSALRGVSTLDSDLLVKCGHMAGGTLKKDVPPAVAARGRILTGILETASLPGVTVEFSLMSLALVLILVAPVVRG
jgi:hypothetical protein